MMVREPAFAGHYYPAQGDACRAEVGRLAEAAPLMTDDAGDWPVSDPDAPSAGQSAFSPTSESTNPSRIPDPDMGGAHSSLVGGIVPHSSWAFCGQLMAGVVQALARRNDPEVIVIIGGTHKMRTSIAAMFGSGRWETPLGGLRIDARLAERVAGQTNLIVDDPYAHESEHGLEVMTPFIAHYFGPVSILPVIVPSNSRAFSVGEAIGRTLKLYDYRALVIGTTDLTHYGPAYEFMPRGDGEAGYRWAKYENDRRFINLVEAMKGRELVEEASRNRNACSSGAIAATLAVADMLRASRAEMIAHTHSREVLAHAGQDLPGDTVGFASFVLRK